MKLEINIKNKDSYNCIQAVMATLADYYDFEYRLGFLNCWNFYYETNNKEFDTIADKLLVADEMINDIIEGFDKYQGIKLRKEELNSFQDLKSYVITRIDNNQPVILIIDDYWCPWSASFKKYHLLHSFIINGYENEYKFICTDPYSNLANQYLNYDIMPNIEYICYTVHEVDNISIDLMIFNDKINQVLRGSEQIEYYINDLKNIYVEKEKANSISLDTIPLMRKLKEIENSRINYAEALSLLKEKIFLSNIDSTIDKLNRIAGLWGKHRYVMIKYFMLSNNSTLLSQSISLASEIAEREKELAFEMKAIFNKSL
jgi:mycobactin peptide synthetase MbtE